MVKGTRSKMIVGPFQTFYLQTLEGQPFQTLSSWGDAVSLLCTWIWLPRSGIDWTVALFAEPSRYLRSIFAMHVDLGGISFYPVQEN